MGGAGSFFAGGDAPWSDARPLRAPTLVLASVLVVAAPAVRADSLDCADDPDAITSIGPGVSELSLGALALVAYHGEGDQTTTRVNMLLGLGYERAIYTNVSVGGQILLSRDRTSDATRSLAFGGAATGTYHVRLGFNAFLRPTLALGLLFGNHHRDIGTGGLVMEASQTAFLTRLQLPLAYYPSQRVVLQAGPELDLELGHVDRGHGESSSYTTLASGFAVGLGYVF